MENFNIGDVLKDALAQAMQQRGHLNILIAGRTGVGKSTLINSVFQGNFAVAGQGRPILQGIREIRKDGIPLSIFDTRGLEMAAFPEILESLRSLISERARSADPNQHIHVAWVCISEDSRRVEPAEEELVKMLADRNIPTLAVITKSRADQGFRAKVLEILPLVKSAVSVRAIEEELDDGHILRVIGLEDLVDATMEAVPDALKNAFVAAQKIDLSLKKKQSHKIVATAAASAGGMALTPIPLADALLIVPIQVGMLASISAVFGLSLDQVFLRTLIGGTIAGAGGPLVGRAIVANLFKLVPGAGSVVGGAILSATAASITVAFGEAYIAALSMLFTKNNGRQPTSAEVTEAFKTTISLRQSKNPQ